MHYRIELVSRRFDKSVSAGSRNINGFAGEDFVRFIAENMKYPIYEELNEDWGWGLVVRQGETTVEYAVSDLRPGETAFGTTSAADGPNWCIVIRSWIPRRRFYLFTSVQATDACEDLGKRLVQDLVTHGDQIMFAGMEER